MRTDRENLRIHLARPLENKRRTVVPKWQRPGRSPGPGIPGGRRGSRQARRALQGRGRLRYKEHPSPTRDIHAETGSVKAQGVVVAPGNCGNHRGMAPSFLSTRCHPRACSTPPCGVYDPLTPRGTRGSRVPSGHGPDRDSSEPGSRGLQPGGRGGVRAASSRDALRDKNGFPDKPGQWIAAGGTVTLGSIRRHVRR